MSSPSLTSRLKVRFRRKQPPAAAAAAASHSLDDLILPEDPNADDIAQLTDLLLETGEEACELEEDEENEASLLMAGSENQRHLQQQRSEELQIKELQAQLLKLTAENLELNARLAESETDKIRYLEDQVEAERQARHHLQEELAASSYQYKIHGSTSRLRRRRAPAAAAGSDATDADANADAESTQEAEEAELESLGSDMSAASEEKEEKLAANASCLERARNWAAGKILDFVDDLQTQPELEASGGSPIVEESLSAKRLRANFTRFGRNTKPIFAFGEGAQQILNWHSPSYTFIVIFLYYCALLFDLVLPAVLLLCIARLLLNYFKYRLHWKTEFSFVSPYESDKGEEAGEKNERKVGTQVNFVVHVAKKVQNLTGKISDSLEKIKNLIMWRTPRQTEKLMKLLLLAFALSLLIPARTFVFYGSLYLGVKLFIVDALFTRYPRLKRKYDSVHRMWRQLPTDQQLGTHQTNRDVEKYILHYSEEDVEHEADQQHDRSPLASDDEHFCQVFALPNMECPLPKWRGGKRCAIICKETDKALPNSLKHGKLFLTRSFLCFERSKDRGKNRPRNIVIPLAMIRRARKMKLFAWLPGGGMAIEVTICGVEKPLCFGAIIGRDDLFDSLREAARKAGLPWASGASSSSSSFAEQQQQQQQLQQQLDPGLVQSVMQALASDSDVDE